jgi:putative transposase
MPRSTYPYIATAEGWLYVGAVLDLFSRRIVGLAMSERMTADLVIKALNQAVNQRNPTNGLPHHSDKGSQQSFVVAIFTTQSQKSML